MNNNTKKPFGLKILVGSLQQELNMKYSDIKDRLDNPEKYFTFVNDVSNEFNEFASALTLAEEKLNKLGVDMKSLPAPDKDYIYYDYISIHGMYFCIYKLIDIQPS